MIHAEITNAVELFGKSPRTTYEGSAHVEVHDIILRGPKLTEEATLAELHAETECEDYAAVEAFPRIARVVGSLAGDREIGRVIITALPPNGIIYPHVDEGPVPEEFDRYHYCAQGGDGNIWMEGTMPYTMQTGELWHTDVSQKHCIVNMMDRERIHVLFDLRKENDHVSS